MLAWISLVLWAFTAAFMASGAWASLWRHKVRRGDPMRLACFWTACVFAGYTLRAKLWPGDDASGTALRLAGMALAIYIIKLGVAYGRGERV